jgi:hydrogenase maturation protein HypF
LALEEKLKGYVLNNTNGVEIEVEGENSALENFIRRIRDELPPAAKITSFVIKETPQKNYCDFEIRLSSKSFGSTLISPDLAVCPDCLTEFNNPRDPRYNYAFINCTNCGPRYSIIESTPYDRPVTSMKSFAMCDYCKSEYNDPLNRRFHAQPIACPVCGPELFFLDKDLQRVSGNPIEKTREAIKRGKIVGIKGIGGFHIACDAANHAAVAELRKRKNRPDKPFAVMCHPEQLSRLVETDENQEKLLKSPIAPILILKKTTPSPIALNVAPNNPNLGVFLPYAPHHYQLISPELPFLIMTSGNRRDEPIAKDESQLQDICDCFLSHNRPILNRSDDSILMPADRNHIIIRRSRGFVPSPMKAPFRLRPTLACGAELKLSFALSNQKEYFLSPYLGNSGSKETMDFYREVVEKYQRWFKLNPELVACDLQPDFATTRFAESLSLPLLKVQHHHAHVAAIMAGRELDEKIIGISFDGTGYGTDGAIWGGEIMVADYRDFDRKFHLQYMPLPGGDAAIKHPVRIAFAYLTKLGLNADDLIGISDLEKKVISRQLENHFNLFQTSSLGRLFDCVAAMLNLYPEISFEAQSAMALEFLCNSEAIWDEKPYSFQIVGKEIIFAELLKEISAAISENTDKKNIAKRFHRTVLEFTLQAAKMIREETGLNKIVLSGGVMQNRIILNGLEEILGRNNFTVYAPHNLPPNDGSISVGQLLIANRKFDN